MATHGSDVESGDGETTTFDGVSRVGGAREAGFVETRGAEDGLAGGATRGTADGGAGVSTTRRRRSTANGVTAGTEKGDGAMAKS